MYSLLLTKEKAEIAAQFPTRDIKLICQELAPYIKQVAGLHRASPSATLDKHYLIC